MSTVINVINSAAMNVNYDAKVVIYDYRGFSVSIYLPPNLPILLQIFLLISTRDQEFKSWQRISLL